MKIRQSLALGALVACAVGTACSSPPAEPQADENHAFVEVAEAVEMDVESLKQRLDAGEDVYVLDVRRDEELEQEGMIEGAAHIPMDQLEARLSEIPKDKPLAIYCHVGGRASRAAAMLREKGYTEPIEYGGISAWKEKGYAVAYPPKAAGSEQ